MDYFNFSVGDTVLIVMADKSISEGVVESIAHKGEQSLSMIVSGNEITIDCWLKKAIVVNKSAFEAAYQDRAVKDYFNVLDKKFGAIMKDIQSEKIAAIASKLREIDQIMETSIEPFDKEAARRLNMIQRAWGNHSFTLEEIFTDYARKLFREKFDTFKTFISNLAKKTKAE